MKVQEQTVVADGPLTGIKVIDLSRVRAGPTASRQLADWGADVISIEPPSRQSDADPLLGPRSGADFQNLNRNRRSITLNLKHPDGVEALKQLVRSADIVLENFRPGVKDRLGIGYEALSAENPRLIYASISAFGQEGPYRDRAGFDTIAQAVCGVMSVTGTQESGPLRAGIPVGDLCAGIFCAQGVLIALLERQRSGRGQWVQTSLMQALAFMLDFQAARYLMEGIVPELSGNEHPTLAPSGILKTRDGLISIAVGGNQVFWDRLCRSLGRDDWINDPRFVSNTERLRNLKALNSAISEILSNEDTAHWVEHLNSFQVPCGPVYRVDQLFADPQFSTLGMVQSLPRDGRNIPYLGQPIVMSRSQSRIYRHTPDLGEHTEEVLLDAGFSSSEIAKMQADEVV